MKYAKPEVVRMEDALRAVRGNGKGEKTRDNAPPHANTATPSAYEADE